MKLISHRGNINGKNIELENSPDYILNSIQQGYDVEIDVWNIKGLWFLGHDNPVYKIDESFLENDKFWCHAKNLQALEFMLSNNKIHSFWHQEDDFTITSKRFIWTYPNKKLTKNSICVSPETQTISNECINTCYGICSDFIEKYKK